MANIRIDITMEPGKRPSREDVFIAIAQIMASRSTCERGQVGCVITAPDHRIISSGYNGTIIGSPHCMDLGCDLTQKCQHSVHAEANAIAFAARYGIPLAGSIMYCTTAPCKSCAMIVIQAGISKVVYLEIYTDDLGIKLMQEHGVTVEQHE